ncbi:hypothetical protein U1Q18_040754 [Sarracenia purpurea var. burkii]
MPAVQLHRSAIPSVRLCSSVQGQPGAPIYTHTKVDDAAQAYARPFRSARHVDQFGSFDQDQPVPSTADPACSSGHLPTPTSHYHIEGVGKLGVDPYGDFWF